MYMDAFVQKLRESKVQKKIFTNGRVYVVDNFYTIFFGTTKKGDAPEKRRQFSSTERFQEI